MRGEIVFPYKKPFLESAFRDHRGRGFGECLYLFMDTQNQKESARIQLVDRTPRTLGPSAADAIRFCVPNIYSPEPQYRVYSWCFVRSWDLPKKAPERF